MKKHVDHFLTSAIDWIFRRRSPGLSLIRVGVPMFAVLLAGWAVKFSYPMDKGPFTFSLDTGASTPLFILIAATSVALILIIVGLILVVRDEHRNGRRKVIAIELRGLRDTSGQPLKDKVPARIMGRRDQLLVDIRQGADGRVSDPEAALKKLTALPATIEQHEAGLDRSDVTFVAAGLAPVPFSFLMGVLLDDETSVELMDWDRSSENWRRLDGQDDNERFSVSGFDKLGNAKEAVLAVSFSYPTNSSAIAKTFKGLPVVQMELANGNADAHWSADKQAALAAQFFETAKKFCATKVRRLHLILAAPNSVVIRFGRSYDKRNLPELVVYQYENGQDPAYPWGILMPVASIPEPTIVSRS